MMKTVVHSSGQLVCAFLLLFDSSASSQHNRAQTAAPVEAIRFKQNPIISEQSNGRIGNNINGPSLITVPTWLAKPLGRYYLYFAHHTGDCIRLAYANKLEGPWTVYEPGTLKLPDTICSGHIASPDVHIDNEKRELRMYFHGPVSGSQRQVSLVATSKDGIHFTASKEVLGDSYFRVFQWRGFYYAMARLGVMYRSRDGLKDFEPGPNPFQVDSTPSRVRHVALKLDGDTLSIFYSRLGDNPESILLSKIELSPDWRRWRASEPTAILKPETEYEGVNLPPAPSKEGPAPGRVRELRDPAIFREGGKDYLLYSVAGESGIAISTLKTGR